MFPSVIPLYGTDCSRVTHPSAARISSVQALQISPLDLHVLSTPPAFVLSQDQTLMFDLSRSRFPCHQLAKASAASAHSLSTLSESDCSCRKHSSLFRMKNARSSSFSVSFSRFARRPPGPLAVSRKGARFKRRMLLYQLSPPLSTPFFSPPQTTISSPHIRKTPSISRFWPLFAPLLHAISVC